tara:strand:+ start:5879 stop:6043 length:165 start_codon:yes stop_codon:yes gene_type:complete
MNKKDIDAAWRLARMAGSANCWTGTSGSIAARLVQAIRRIEELEAEVERLKNEK